ncbi:MAG: ribosome small subunit-dependent GTPase A [Bacteroidales bacterium]|nr:ribosome small subunit-dependent GTPase A [Bacteroidales bacterium]
MREGTVIKSTGSRYRVLDDAGTVHDCTIKGRFRTRGIRTTNPVAVGDRVTIDEHDGVICALTPRLNYIIRRASNLSKESQIIAANIDQAFLMVTLKMPSTPVEFIDRFLASAEAYRIPVSLVINKSDLYGAEEMEMALRVKGVYEKVGYPGYIISVTEGINIDQIKEALKGKVTLISGNSGVGKSSLLNRLNPSLSLRTDDISEFHEQGKHVTTFPEMHPLPGGGYVIDTPGIRGFGVIDFDRNEIYHFFPEIFRQSSGCRFYNCRHLSEPDCAVRSAVTSGEIEQWRYKSYVSMMLGENPKYR